MKFYWEIGTPEFYNTLDNSSKYKIYSQYFKTFTIFLCDFKKIITVCRKKIQNHLLLIEFFANKWNI